MTVIFRKITAAALAASMLMLWACSPNGEAHPDSSGDTEKESIFESGTESSTERTDESLPPEDETEDTGEDEGGDVVDKTDTVFGKGGEIGSYNADEANYGLSIDASKGMHDISDLLFGIFFEDINFAADG